MPLKRSISAFRVVRGQLTAPFGMHRSEWLYLPSGRSISANSLTIFFFCLTAWNTWSCSGPYENYISFFVNSRKGAVIDANSTGLSTSSGYSLNPGSSADPLRCLGISWQVWLSPSCCLAWHLRVSKVGRRNSLHHTLTVAHPKPARPLKRRVWINFWVFIQLFRN